MNYHFPPLLVERAAHFLARRLVYRRGFKHYGERTYLSPFSTWENMQFMSIGSGVTVRRGAWICVLPGNIPPGEEPQLSIGDDSYLGNNCVVSCVREVRIGRQVVFGDNVQVGDTTHRYQTPGEHLFAQGLDSGRLVIGDRAWIGRNSFVGYDLEIGEHAVVGANSVVTRSVPPFTVVAGSPARPIRRFDVDSGTWIRL